MWNKLRNYFCKERKEMLVAICIGVLIVLSYGLYLKYVGLPMTRARNKHNEAVLLLSSGDKEAARELLNESLEYWETPEARQLLNELN